MNAFVGDVKGGVVEAIGQNFGTHFDFEFQKREFSLGVVYGKIEADAVEKTNLIEFFAKTTKIGCGYGNLCIDTLFCDIGSSYNIHRRPLQIESIAKGLRILNVRVLIKRNRDIFVPNGKQLFF